MKISPEEIARSVEIDLNKRKEMLQIAETTEIKDYKEFLLNFYYANMNEEEYALKRKGFLCDVKRCSSIQR